MQYTDEYFLDRITKIFIKVTKDKDYGIKFSMSYLFDKEDKWICLARIDNHPHEGKIHQTHIHRFGERKVQYMDMTIDEAKKRLILIGNNIRGKL